MQRTESITGLLRDSVAMVLAGGEGQRLYPLTRVRAKPAVRFGGVYRIMDFTLSNCLHSGLRRIYLMTQYAATSMARHVYNAWLPLVSEELDEFIEMLPPQRMFADRWYAGTADAVFQNLLVLQEQRPSRVFLLSGDHIYAMDYSQLLARQEETGADLVIACMPRPLEEARQLGVMQVEEGGRVVGFQEKPEQPAPMPGRPDRALVNMGVYLWRTETLARKVAEDATRDGSHDFGKDILPRMVEQGEAVSAYFFYNSENSEPGYWRDIGTLDSYWRTTLDLVGPVPELNLYDETWPVYGSRLRYSPAKCVSGEQLEITETLLSPGCIISGARVRGSVLSPGVRVEEGAEVETSIVMDRARIGAGAKVTQAILDEGVEIPPGYEVGGNPERDR